MERTTISMLLTSLKVEIEKTCEEIERVTVEDGENELSWHVGCEGQENLWTSSSSTSDSQCCRRTSAETVGLRLQDVHENLAS